MEQKKKNFFIFLILQGFNPEEWDVEEWEEDCLLPEKWRHLQWNGKGGKVGGREEETSSGSLVNHTLSDW